MRAYGLRLPIVLTALVVALGAFFGLQAVYAQQSLAGPLVTHLEKVPGVKGTPHITRTAGGLDIQIQLGLVPDFETTYRDLNSVAQANAGGRTVALRIVDARSPQLVNDYSQLTFVLDQARATGGYVTMDSQFQQEAQGMHLQRATVSISQTQIFVTLVQGTHYLYAVMPLLLTGGSGGGSTG